MTAPGKNVGAGHVDVVLHPVTLSRVLVELGSEFCATDCKIDVGRIPLEKNVRPNHALIEPLVQLLR
jgi:hypothetical protein